MFVVAARGLTKFALTTLVSICFFFGCSEKCIPSIDVNCNVNQSAFQIVNEGMPIQEVEKLLGSPYLYLPEVTPGANGIGKYIWLKLKASDARGEQSKIVVETRNGKVLSKKLEEYLM